MSYCKGSQKATVIYTNSSKVRVRREVEAPINAVVILPKIPGTYRFYGTGDDKIFYQFTAQGTNPGYAINSGFNSRVYTPTMNGVFIKPQDYYYVSGYGIGTLIAPVDYCQIQVTGGSNFTDKIECPDGNYQVSCDDDCPSGFCKCHSDSYPGYCCNDCNATSASLQNISNQLLKKLKNGR